MRLPRMLPPWKTELPLSKKESTPGLDLSQERTRVVQESSINWNRKTLQNHSNSSYSMASSKCSCPTGEVLAESEEIAVNMGIFHI